MSGNLPEKPQGDIVIYRTADGQSRIQVHMEGGTVWLSQALIAELLTLHTSSLPWVTGCDNRLVNWSWIVPEGENS